MVIADDLSNSSLDLLNRIFDITGISPLFENIDLIKTIIKIVDRLLKREVGTSEKLINYVADRPGHDFRYAIDSSKINKELGWKPSLQFEEGIEKTVAWYLNNKEWLEKIISREY